MPAFEDLKKYSDPEVIDCYRIPDNQKIPNWFEKIKVWVNLFVKYNYKSESKENQNSTEIIYKIWTKWNTETIKIKIIGLCPIRSVHKISNDENRIFINMSKLDENYKLYEIDRRWIKQIEINWWDIKIDSMWTNEIEVYSDWVKKRIYGISWIWSKWQILNQIFISDNTLFSKNWNNWEVN